MKKDKRRELKKLRASLDDKDKLSSLIQERFLGSDIYKNSQTILLYYSVGSEVSTLEIFNRALADEKQLALPVCLTDDGKMEFFIVGSQEDLTDGMYGIKEPAAYCEKTENTKDSVCVVPALAFDKNGYRLGYGKGYYDRFLQSFEGISVGLCFEAMLQDSLPKDEFDMKTDYLITDKNIYKF